MKDHTDKELIDFLTSLKTGAVTLISDDEPQRVYVGNVYYQSSNGWQVAVNIDCNNFEHFIVFVSGDRITDFDGMPVYIHSYFRKSSSDEIYRIFGIPGYMIVRSDRWMGYNHTPIKGLRYYWEDIKAKVNLWKFRRNQT
jgi:hypothetical protein